MAPRDQKMASAIVYTDSSFLAEVPSRSNSKPSTIDPQGVDYIVGSAQLAGPTVSCANWLRNSSC